MSEITSAVRRQVARMLRPNVVAPEAIDLERSLVRGYGLTSMSMVLLITALCEELDVPLSAFTDRDVAAIDSARDLAAALGGARHGG